MLSSEAGPSGVSDLQERRARNLLSRITDDDREAFAELVHLFGAACLGLAVRVARDRALAEEALQEVFASLWQRADAYDPARGSVRAWLFAQVHHRAVDVVRKEEAERRRSITTFPPLDPPRTEEDFIEESWLTARRAHVRRVLDSLPDEQRRILELAYFDGRTQTQIAETMGLPLGTVKSRTLAALRRMRRRLSSLEREQ